VQTNQNPNPCRTKYYHVQPTAKSDRMAFESMTGYIKQEYVSVSMATLPAIIKKRRNSSGDNEPSDDGEVSYTEDDGEPSDDGEASYDDEPSDDSEASGDGEPSAVQFTVQRILAHQGAGSVRRNLCVWDGFPDPSENTWEPACNVSGVPAHISYL